MIAADRELLELAAKAAGYEWSQKIAEKRKALGLIALWITSPRECMHTAWNPRDNDADALRLAVRLSLCIEFGYCADDAPVVRCGPEWERESWPEDANFPDPNAATRLAILRAAAEIGRSMP